MGNTNRVSTQLVLLLGLEKSGKSLFLKKILELKKRDSEDIQLEATIGFNYIQVDQGAKYDIWELGGDAISRSYWPTFYRNLKAYIVIFFINVYDKATHWAALKELIILINEEELKAAKFFIIFNIKIDDDDKKLSFNDNDMKEVLETVESLLYYLKECPIHDYDNRVTHFITDISKMKEGEHMTSTIISRCFMTKESKSQLND